MKFLIDAQLPPSLAMLLKDRGHDAIHTLSLPEKNFSSDETINKYSVRDHSFILKRERYKLLLVRVGNLRKDKLNQVIIENLETLVKYFRNEYMVELTQNPIKLLY